MEKDTINKVDKLLNTHFSRETLEEKLKKYMKILT